MRETEDVLASELSKLTMQERTKAMDDLHCVGEDLEETPSMIEQTLEMVDEAVHLKHDEFYDMAARQNRAYVEDRSFRLRFIRANLHGVEKSVSQIYHFLRNKAKYFGAESLGRDITINDLNEEDRELLMSGIYHVQAERDQNGRVILYTFSELNGKCRAESLCRVAYYVYFNILSAITEVQTKGLVLVFYDNTKIDDVPTVPTLGLTVALMDMVKCLPIRFTAFHLCMKTRHGKLNLFDPLTKVVCNIMEEYTRVRTKLHYGSDLELQYGIRGHGISIRSCPVDSDDDLREDIKNIWLHDYLKTEVSINSKRAAQPSGSTFCGTAAVPSLEDHPLDFDALHHSLDHDAQELFGNFPCAMLSGNAAAMPSAAAGIEGDQGNCARITPTENDILLGRGRFAQNNLGNICFRDFVGNRKNEYDEAPRGRRREIITEMRRILSSRGVRFLKQIEKDVWVESSSKETDKKIAQLFREFRKQK